MIKLGLLKFSNCLPFGKDLVIDLANSNVTQLVGKNGSGKSSIPLILEELLYNKNSKGVAKGDILNRYSGAQEYSMSLTFEVDGISYQVSKEVKSTAKVKLLKEGKDISGHTATQTYKELAEILGMEMATFSKLVYQSLLSSLDFLTATDGNRKKFLITLLNLEKYSKIEATIKEAKKTLTSEMAKVNTELQAANKVLSGLDIPDKLEPKIVPESLEGKYSEVMELTSSRAVLDTELKTIQDRYNEQLARSKDEERRFQDNLKAWNRTFDALTKIEQLREEGRSIVKAITESKDQLDKIQRPAPSNLQSAKDYVDALTQDINKTQWNIDELKKTYKELKSDADNTVCKVCNSVLDKAHASKEAERIKSEFDSKVTIRNNLRERLEQSTAEYNELVFQENSFSKTKQHIINLEKELSTLTDNLTALEADVLRDLGMEGVSANPTLNLLSAKPTMNSSAKPTINLVEDTESLTAQINQIDKDILQIRLKIQERNKEMEETIKYNNEVLVNNAKIESLLDMFNKSKTIVDEKSSIHSELETRANRLDTLLKVFSSKGLIAYKLESSVKVFENKVNNYLSELSNGKFALGFELDEANLKVVIYSEGVQVNIKTLSSGELSKVNISTLLAIRGLMSAIAKNSLNVLFLDEVVSTIDQEGMEDLITVLLKEYELNTFVVSHNYTHPLVDVLKIEKENNISRIIND